jgi:hypothetical protein
VQRLVDRQCRLRTLRDRAQKRLEGLIDGTIRTMAYELRDIDDPYKVAKQLVVDILEGERARIASAILVGEHAARKRGA